MRHQVARAAVAGGGVGTSSTAVPWGLAGENFASETVLATDGAESLHPSLDISGNATLVP